MPPASLFRTRIRHVIPGGLGGADLQCCGIGEDGMDWAIKLPATPGLPASELLGYRLYEACGYALPYYALLDMPDNAVAFGSRIEGGLLEEQPAPKELVARLHDNADAVCAVLATDLFFANDDRHVGNFLWRRNRLGIAAPLTIDFSRAFLTRGWPLPPTWMQPCNTTAVVSLLRVMRLWQPAAAQAGLLAIGRIDVAAWARWVGEMPPEWLEPSLQSQLRRWWGSEDFHQRITHCSTYCA